ncbi:MAG TPA: hypothetical protein VFB07_06680 [Vicinamibacterales bacterium]|nr:hypothetical protein [Vicinamibacterales bacterium]
MVITSRFVPAFALLGALVAAPACATGGYGYRAPGPYEQGRYGREVERIAHDRGFRDGREAGEKDGRRGRSFSFDRHDDWRDADDGYRRDYGDREFYRREFREGFRAGYTEGYNAFARGYRR